MGKSILFLGCIVGALGCSESAEPSNDQNGVGDGAAGDPSSGGGAGPGPGGGTSNAGGSSSSSGGSTNGGAPPNGGGAPGAGGSPTPGAGGSPTPGAGGSPAPGCVENLACTLAPPPPTGDLALDCVNRINQFRVECACLEPLERWTDGEACADQMAEYDSARDTAHAGFRDGICEGGSGQNECPGHRSNEAVIERCLQGMWSEGPPPVQPCDGACFQEYGHFINMTNPRHTRVACGFFTTAGGEVWAVQNFSR